MSPQTTSTASSSPSSNTLSNNQQKQTDDRQTPQLQQPPNSLLLFNNPTATCPSPAQTLSSKRSSASFGQPNKTKLFGIDELNPDRNGLKQVIKDFYSSILTVRLNGVAKINRVIEYSNDLYHPVVEQDDQFATKYRESTRALRQWILDKRIIENIFGPNCHVEVIKQSHIILNFVASELTKEHINVIWATSLLKHCGKQVLELLANLIRFMRPIPVLHIYDLLKTLCLQDHSEHTLFLASHVLRYIWSHSASINQHYSPAVRDSFKDIDDSNKQHITNSEVNQETKLLKAIKQTFPLTRSVSELQNCQDLSSRLSNEKQAEDNLNDSESIKLTHKRLKSLVSCFKEENQDEQKSILEQGTSINSSLHHEQASIKDSIDENHNNPPNEQQIPENNMCSENEDQYSSHSNNVEHAVVCNPEESALKLREWLNSANRDQFLDNTSETDACCSEEKNMADFDDISFDDDDESATSQHYFQDDNSYFAEDPGASSCSSDAYNGNKTKTLCHSPNYKSIQEDDSNELTDISRGNKDFNQVKIKDASENQKCAVQIQRPLTYGTQSHTIDSVNHHFKDLKPRHLNSQILQQDMEHEHDDEDFQILNGFNIVNLSEPGKTILWDLLQDEKIESIAVALQAEIENVFVNLIMTFGDRFIRLKFIEACLENLSVGKSVIISLRLLPRLMSFATPSKNLPLSTMTETHMIVLWAEKEFSMSQNFFKDFVHYSKLRSEQIKCINNSDGEDKLDFQNNLNNGRATNAELNHMEKIITRLSFLTFIYSRAFSPPSMSLTIEQMDSLWDCVATDKQCADVLFQWLINQAITEDLHAVDGALLDYILREKLPSLEPETFSMRGLKLLEQLLWHRQDDGCCHSLSNPGTQLLWNIGLRATITEVSMAAVRILNHFYIYSGHSKQTKCDRGTHFIDTCMQQMSFTFNYFSKCDNDMTEEKLVTVIQRALVLLRTHLEVFRSRWSFYLKVLQLNDEANLISHRSNTFEVKSIMTLRIPVHAASRLEKTTIEVQSNDYVGELRATIAKWWFTSVDRYNQMSPSASSSSSISGHSDKNPSPSCSSTYSDLTNFLHDHYQSLRLVSQNQDIPIDMDDRQITELDLKEDHVIYVLPSARNNIETEAAENSNIIYPLKSEIPSLLMLQPKYFEQLLDADHFLGSYQGKSNIINTRTQTLSRRVWEIIQVLPTSPSQLETYMRYGLLSRVDDETPEFTLPSPSCPQRLLYSLQVIDILRSSNQTSNWSNIFINNGGLKYMFELFLSSDLMPSDHNEVWNEWQQECLACLLKLIYQLGTKQLQSSIVQSSESITSTKSSNSSKTDPPASKKACVQASNQNISHIKRIRRSKTSGRQTSANCIYFEDRYPIRHFSNDLFMLIPEPDLIFNKLISILKFCAYCDQPTDYYVTVSSRSTIVHHLMSFMAAWCISDSKFPKFLVSEYRTLIRAIILNDSDPCLRREACTGLYRLHWCASFVANRNLDRTSSSSSTSSSISSIGSESARCVFSQDLLQCLIEFLPMALEIKPPRSIRNYFDSETDILKELMMPGCKDYFWLTCRLIDAVPSNSFSNLSVSPDDTKAIDLDVLCTYLAEAIISRQTFETRDLSIEDDGLKGLLLMMVIASRRNPSFKHTKTAYNFIYKLFYCLFATPTPTKRFLPKCKSRATRSTAFDLMLELVDKSRVNYLLLVQLLIRQHELIIKNSYPQDYWPHDDSRSEVGFVGLVNLGATCYLATCIQHLFMIPHLRYSILSIKNVSDIRHGSTIRELQRMFAFMLESERKAYNPRNFCKTYTMDHQPLNIAEQKDMTEFLTDLIAKLEESSPELRYIIKSLFSGSLSNNVVSLDCPHISKTTEEFYTLRCQVADMRNLNDSLDELTVKDTLEGDNMYTCSTCSLKVRAEKRACIVKLPKILCFNTMRYTFNMATMMKEKVNTHFSFPLKLDMSNYLEKNLIKRQRSPSSADSSGQVASQSCVDKISKNYDNLQKDIDDADNDTKKSSPTPDESSTCPPSDCTDSLESEDEEENTKYDLIGVTVHTGTAEGGHYYCFIRDCEDTMSNKDRWYYFNDAEVKQFDASQLGTECFGGEMTTKSYDAVNDRFMDFSFEKTNSAYMLFYKRADYQYNSKSVALRYQEADTQRVKNVDEADDSNVDKFELDDNAFLTVDEKETSSESIDMENCKKILKTEGKTDCGRNFKNNESKKETDEEEDTNIKDESKFDSKMDFSRLISETYSDFQLPNSLSEWIWADNTKFCRDKHVFEQYYYNFMWQICAIIPKNLHTSQSDTESSSSSVSANNNSDEISDDLLTLKTIHLAISFVLGILMHSREKPTISHWTELLRKQFTSSQVACDWLMNLIDDEDTWLKQMLLKCPIEMVRQLFQRLCNDLTHSNNNQHKKLRFSR